MPKHNKNCKQLRIQGREVLVPDEHPFHEPVRKRRPRLQYDIIFADPPYAKAIGDRDMIAELMTDRLHELLADGGYFIAEAQEGYGVGDSHSREFPGWKLVDARYYGKNVILFYQVESI